MKVSVYTLKGSNGYSLEIARENGAVFVRPGSNDTNIFYDYVRLSSREQIVQFARWWANGIEDVREGANSIEFIARATSLLANAEKTDRVYS